MSLQQKRAELAESQRAPVIDILNPLPTGPRWGLFHLLQSLQKGSKPKHSRTLLRHLMRLSGSQVKAMPLFKGQFLLDGARRSFNWRFLHAFMSLVQVDPAPHFTHRTLPVFGTGTLPLCSTSNVCSILTL